MSICGDHLIPDNWLQTGDKLLLVVQPSLPFTKHRSVMTQHGAHWSNSNCMWAQRSCSGKIHFQGMPAWMPRKSPGFWGVAQRTAKSSPCRKYTFFSWWKEKQEACAVVRITHACLPVPCWVAELVGHLSCARCLSEPLVSFCFSWGAAGWMTSSFLYLWLTLCLHFSISASTQRACRAQLPTCCQWFAWDKHTKSSRSTIQR